MFINGNFIVFNYVLFFTYCNIITIQASFCLRCLSNMANDDKFKLIIGKICYIYRIAYNNTNYDYFVKWMSTQNFKQ